MLQRKSLIRRDDSALLRHSGLFDAGFYLWKYPDVASSALAPLEHYLELGGREKRDPHPLFDTTYYLEKNPDVASSRLNPLVHYILHGAEVGRDPHPLFDSAYYLEQNPEPVSADMNPLVHYILHGRDLKLDPHPLFDTTYYLEKYPHVASCGLSPLVHYILRGAEEGLDPHPLFDSTFYLQQYPDVAEGKVNPLKHYVQNGRLEERLPRNFFLDSVAGSLAKHYPLLHEIEPLLPALDDLERLRVRKSLKASPAGEAYFKLASMLDEPFTHLVLVGDLSSKDWHHCDLVNSLVDDHGADSVLVIAADLTADSWDEAIRQKLPRNVRFIGQDQLQKELTMFHRMMVVVRLILQAAPEAVYNCRSELCSIIFREYKRQLADVTSLIDCASPRANAGDKRRVLQDPPAKPATPTPDSSNTAGATHSCDITLIVNCHAEGKLLIPTISAASMAVEHARNAHLTVEWLFVLDRADEVTRQHLKEHMPVDGRAIEMNLGDPGLARNAGVLEARGQFVAFVDGDDLVSRNWLEAAYNFARTFRDKPVILHPLGTIYFGDNEFINLDYDGEDPDFSRTALMDESLWLVNHFAKRSLYLQNPYRSSDLQRGFGFEDWQWNCDTVACGIVHKLVPDTFFCYRVKPSLASRNASAHSCILGRSTLFDLKFQIG